MVQGEKISKAEKQRHGFLPCRCNLNCILKTLSKNDTYKVIGPFHNSLLLKQSFHHVLRLPVTLLLYSCNMDHLPIDRAVDRMTPLPIDDPLP